MNFLIAGLPRSKTAWMSVVCSTVPGAICYHEPIVKYHRWECCFDIWESSKYRYVGVSDSSLAFQFERIIAQANPRILIIHRDLDDVKRSLRALGGPQSNYPEILSEKLRRYMTHPSVAWIEFEKLKDPAFIEQCLAYLMPGCLIDHEKIEELIHMNIQEDMERVWDFAMAQRAPLDVLLGPEVMLGLTVFQ